MDSDLSQKVAKKYIYKLYDYNTSNSNDYKKHLATDKHKNATNGGQF